MPKKFKYENPFTQKVAELCDKGFWPICKNQNNHYAIFTPIRNGQGCLRRSTWSETIEVAKGVVGGTSHHSPDLQPIDFVRYIDGNPIFYHPPTPKFKIGDRVRVRKDLINTVPYQDDVRFLLTAGKSGEVDEVYPHAISVLIDDYPHMFNPDQLEPVTDGEV